MKPLSEKQIARWEKQRAKGKIFNIVKDAILWSIWMTVWFSVVDYFRQKPITQSSITISMIVNLIFGILLSSWNWSSTESAYQASSKAKSIETFNQ